MRKSKFIRLLTTLNSKERREFNAYLEGLHYQERLVIRVFEIINKKLSKSISVSIEKEEILSHESLVSYKLSNKRIVDLMSTLYSYLEDFLIQKKLKETDRRDYRDLLVMKILKERNLDDLHSKKSRQIFKNIKYNNELSSEHFLRKFELNHLSYFNTKKDNLTTSSRLLYEGIENLDSFYILVKLKYACEVINRNKVLLIDHLDMTLQQEIINLVESQEKRFTVLHNLYLLAYKLLMSNDKEIYIRLKKLLITNKDSFLFEDKSIITGYLLNFTISQIRKNNSSYSDIFNLYKFALTEDLMIEGGIMSYVSFMNIVSVASTLKEFRWLYNFIYKYSKFLPSDISENVVNISRAYISFELGNYEETQEILIQTPYNRNVGLTLRSKSLSLRAIYELYKGGYQSRESLRYSLAAFSRYISRDKYINNSIKEAYLNFAKVMRRMIDKKVDKKKLREIIESDSEVFFKKWLLQKIEQIE